MHQSLADATFRIECGQMTGSGFSFRSPGIVVTNSHVVGDHISTKQPIIAHTENSVQIPMRLIAHSPEVLHDFAILEAQQALPARRSVLQPNITADILRGTEVVFAGFPHGISDLLTQEAIVSGPAGTVGFYIDGSVNGGNSGGPIVDKLSGRLVGIVTQRRFLGAVQLDQLRQSVGQLSKYCQTIAGRGSVNIMGVDFGGFAQMMADGFTVIDHILQANANSGIGIGFRIEFVNREYDRLSLP